MDHLALLRGEVVAFAEALDRADHTTPVVACPGWTVADVSTHLAHVHRWAAASLAGTTPPSYDFDAPLVETYLADGLALVDALAEVPAEHPCWTFDRDDRTAGFWRRRQLHEVAVHRWDVETACGQVPVLDETVAADGIDEVTTFLAPRQLRRAAVPEGAVVLRWPGGQAQLGEGDVQATVEGRASDLLLVLWHRLPLARVTVSGDAALLGAALVP